MRQRVGVDDAVDTDLGDVGGIERGRQRLLLLGGLDKDRRRAYLDLAHSDIDEAVRVM
jgi:hypothetical protein